MSATVEELERRAVAIDGRIAELQAELDALPPEPEEDVTSALGVASDPMVDALVTLRRENMELRKGEAYRVALADEEAKIGAALLKGRAWAKAVSGAGRIAEGPGPSNAAFVIALVGWTGLLMTLIARLW